MLCSERCSIPYWPCPAPVDWPGWSFCPRPGNTTSGPTPSHVNSTPRKPGSGKSPATNFTIDLHLVGSDFQVKVWTHLLKIPYGKVRTYGQIARSMRNPTAFRAVGQAAGHNPLPILVPCHRVVGKGGSLVGFAAGITTKARLLRLEGHTLDASRIEEPRLF